jgi:hypothetical protein
MSLKVFNGVEWISTGVPGPKGDQGATGLPGFGETGSQGATGPNALTMDNGVRVSFTGALSVPNGMVTSILYDTELRDDNNYWSIGDPTKITIPEDGWYSFGVRARWNPGTISTYCGLHIYLNNLTIIASQTGVITAISTTLMHSISSFYYFTAGSYIVARLIQYTGAMSISESDFWCFRVSTGPQGATGLSGIGETGLQGVTGPAGIGSGDTGSFYSVELTGDRVTGLSLFASPIMYGTSYTGPIGSFPEGTLYFQYV